MLSITEHQELMEATTTLEGLLDSADEAEFYDIAEDPITLEIKVTLYDANGAPLGSAVVDDYDYAVVFMEEYFDIDPIDDEDIDATASASGSAWGHDNSGNSAEDLDDDATGNY